jgi:hypothetical protein
MEVGQGPIVAVAPKKKRMMLLAAQNKWRRIVWWFWIMRSSDSHLTGGAIPQFAWKDWGKTWVISTRTASVRSKTCLRKLPRRKHDCYPLLFKVGPSRASHGTACPQGADGSENLWMRKEAANILSKLTTKGGIPTKELKCLRRILHKHLKYNGRSQRTSRMIQRPRQWQKDISSTSVMKKWDTKLWNWFKWFRTGPSVSL